MDEKALALAKAIRKAETGTSSKPYQAKGASGETGAYQFMPDTWRQWSKQYLGKENAPLSVENQNKVAYSRIKELKDQGYKPAEIASMWNSGRADSYKQGKKGTNKYGASYDVPAYVAKVSSYYKQLAPRVQQPATQIEKPFRYDVPVDNKANLERATMAQVEAIKQQKQFNPLKEFTKSFVGNLMPSEVALGKTISKTFGNQSQSYANTINSLTKTQSTLMQQIKDKESRGEDSTNLKRVFNQNADQLDELQNTLKQESTIPTTGQVAGQLGGTALDTLTAGTYGKTASALKTGALGKASPSIISNLSADTKFLSKPTAKTVGAGLGIGYGYDVSQGLMDQERNPYTPGLGTALGGGIALAGRIGVSRMRPAESKFQDLVEKRAKELYKVENKYAKTRKGMEYSKDEGYSSRKRISETDVLVGAVDDTGTIRTKQKGGPIDQYKEQTIGKSEGLVMKDLEREARSIDFKKVEEKVLKTIEDAKALPAGERELAINKATKELNALRKEVDSNGMLPLTSLQREKVANYALNNYETPAEVSAYRKALARAYKELIEKNSSVDVKTTNTEIAKYLEDINRLEKLDGTKVEGGKLGKYFAQISGNIIGSAAGGIGGPAGSAFGAVVGGEAASVIKGGMMRRTFGKATGRTAPKSEILEKVKARAESPRLALPAPTTPFKKVYTSGKSINLPARMDQSYKFGNLNTTYNPSNTKNINVIPKNVAQKSLKEKGITVKKIRSKK